MTADIKKVVKEKYGEAALRVMSGGSSCCGAAACGTAGFEGISIEPTRIYRIDDARTFLGGQGIDVDAIASDVDGKFMSAFILATKPQDCCSPDCCS